MAASMAESPRCSAPEGLTSASAHRSLLAAARDVLNAEPPVNMREAVMEQLRSPLMWLGLAQLAWRVVDMLLLEGLGPISLAVVETLLIVGALVGNVWLSVRERLLQEMELSRRAAGIISEYEQAAAFHRDTETELVARVAPQGRAHASAYEAGSRAPPGTLGARARLARPAHALTPPTHLYCHS